MAVHKSLHQLVIVNTNTKRITRDTQPFIEDVELNAISLVRVLDLAFSPPSVTNVLIPLSSGLTWLDKMGSSRSRNRNFYRFDDCEYCTWIINRT